MIPHSAVAMVFTINSCILMGIFVSRNQGMALYNIFGEFPVIWFLSRLFPMNLGTCDCLQGTVASLYSHLALFTNLVKFPGSLY